jgi:uncharacterized protein (TIGR02300 family)
MFSRAGGAPSYHARGRRVIHRGCGFPHGRTFRGAHRNAWRLRCLVAFSAANRHPLCGKCSIDSSVARRQGKHRFFARRRIEIVAKAELGTKRLCGNCGAKFYDLHKNPIVCPKCSTVFVPPTATRGRPEAARVPEPVEEAVVPEAVEAEFVPLEEVDKEAEGAKTPVAEGAEDEVDETLDDATFIVPEEEEDEDVTDIIGDGIEDDEET